MVKLLALVMVTTVNPPTVFGQFEIVTPQPFATMAACESFRKEHESDIQKRVLAAVAGHIDFDPQVQTKCASQDVPA